MKKLFDHFDIWEAGDLKTPKCVSCNRCHSTPGSRCILA